MYRTRSNGDHAVLLQHIQTRVLAQGLSPQKQGLCNGIISNKEGKCKRPKNIICTICNKQFATPGKLKIHQRAHTKEKPYQCKYCTKRYRQRSAVTIHERTHTKEKPFKCDSCGNAFIRTGDLKVHIMRFHTKEKTVQVSAL